MNRTQFKGTGVALVTPFTTEKEVDVKALARLVNFQIDNGIDYIVVLGTTAESATLSAAEKELVKKTIREANDGRLPLVLGLGSNNTADLIQTYQKENFEGFDAILSVSPFYNKPTQEGIYQHFSNLAKVSELPIIIYNVPGRTGSNMSSATVVRLAQDFENIIGIKEAAGDLAQAMTLIRDTPKDFLVISGEDMITLPMVLAGGAGVISVMAEGFPKEFSQMLKFGFERQVDEAFAIQYQLMAGMDLIFEEGNPAGIKAVFQAKSLCEPDVRLPLVEATPALKTKLTDFIKTLK
ncbi:MAG: 4-hydroxy-tetrahydrodipicolinate synthase [Psychroflexus sp.]|nr:4-hydroxy-tetrahydrodipicolinate synthase [Psychroflexus sp.]MDN6310580.1 4-hydroxy-tetrahydrodipicolinate synthase [Psychroflexus sp.]